MREFYMKSFSHVLQNIERVSKDLVESMKGFSTATVSFVHQTSQTILGGDHGKRTL